MIDFENLKNAMGDLEEDVVQEIILKMLLNLKEEYYFLH